MARHAAPVSAIAAEAVLERRLTDRTSSANDSLAGSSALQRTECASTVGSHFGHASGVPLPASPGVPPRLATPPQLATRKRQSNRKEDLSGFSHPPAAHASSS